MYTHHWVVDEKHAPLLEEHFTQLEEDAKALAEAASVTVQLDIQPDESITLNGSEDEAGDPLIIKPGVQSFGTVTTGKKDYDEVVVALLLRLAHYVEDFDVISSDGSWDSEEWNIGRRLYERVFPDRPEQPSSMIDKDDD